MVMWGEYSFGITKRNYVFNHLCEGVIEYNKNKRCRYCNDVLSLLLNTDKTILTNLDNGKLLSLLCSGYDPNLVHNFFDATFWKQKSFYQLSSLTGENSFLVKVFPKYTCFNRFDGLVVLVYNTPENIRIRQLNKQVQTINTLLDKLSTVQRDSLLKIDELSLIRNSFTRTVCQNFRNHLNIIYGFTQLLNRETFCSSEASLYITHILSQCDELILLINQLNKAESALNRNKDYCQNTFTE